ncbi:alpha/beta fold hydrolase [Micromonospora sp. CA-248260]|uniref:alpha/beta fold hydrolase n=1 Tax=Micromonospora sp. CA-248260 TaxID=3239962 RepID=UPI003D8AE007
MVILAQDAAASNEGSTTVRDARAAWTRAGTGPLAVYAHALSQDRDSLAGPGGVLDLTPVTEVRTLVRYDARGHGRSDGSLDPGDYAYRVLAADLLELIGQWSPTRPVAGIGTSMGTATLLHAATREPDRFDALVLTAPPTAWQARAGQGDAYRSLAAAIERDGLDSMMGTVQAAATPAIMRDGPPLTPRITEEFLPTVLRGVATSDLPAAEAIARLRVPVLILSWADDPTHPVATGERLHELIPGSTFRVAATRREVEGWPALIADFLAQSATGSPR